MTRPIVAVVGRPNVGKSTLFNKIVGHRISIVQDRAGVTRDRLYADCEWCGNLFTLVDTGGLELKSDDVMFSFIREQVILALDTAEVIIFVVDYKTGLTAEDYEVASMLRRTKKPVIVAVNKVDHYTPEAICDYYSLGLGEIFGISAEAGTGVADMLDEVVKELKSHVHEDEYQDAIKIAVVGRPNAGKSSLVNKILGYDRTIVSDIAGTTRDAIDTPFTRDGKRYVIIDTAGMRRQRSVDDSVESFSVMRAMYAISRADVCLIVIDAEAGITEQDVRIAGYVHEEGKASVVVMNKWDIVEKDTYTINKFNDQLKQDLKFMDYFRSVYISARTGKRVDQVLTMVDEVHERATTKIKTGLLNDVIQDAISANEPPSKNGKRLKIFYCTQVDVQPPVFALFVNDKTVMHFSYKRYLENALRSAFSLEGTPIRFSLRDKSEEDYTV
ncbi:MAG: ribosome biogenesis GTPase Der [Clostridia bacterium]|nr:ribosome biogenesis GTPase Der [Clostridia bacterium]